MLPTKAVGSGAAGSSFQPTYDSGTNRISASLSVVPSYTKDGNLISDPTSTSSQAIYSWDAADHLVSDASSGVSITYDALGRAVEISGGPQGSGWHAVVYGPAGGKLAVMTGNTLVKAWVALPGGETAVYTAANSAPAYYEHPDLLGSSRLATTPGRALWSDQAYAPYGENIGNYSKTGAGALDLNFTGQTPDSDSSLYDFLFRHYAPAQGRWLKPDPAGLAAVNLADPQSWNRYGYVGNAPDARTDPSGLCDVVVGGITQFVGSSGSQGQSDFAASIGADEAYPYADHSTGLLGLLGNLDSVLGASLGVNNSAVATTVAALQDAISQTPAGQSVNVFAISGGAQAFSTAFHRLTAPQQARIGNVTYLMPGGAGSLVNGNSKTTIVMDPSYGAFDPWIEPAHLPGANVIWENHGHHPNSVFSDAGIQSTLKGLSGGKCSSPKTFSAGGGGAPSYTGGPGSHGAPTVVIIEWQLSCVATSEGTGQCYLRPILSVM